MAFDPTTVVATPVEQPPEATAFDPSTATPIATFDPTTVQAEAPVVPGQLPNQDIVDRVRRGEAVGIGNLAKAMVSRTLAKGGYIDQGVGSAFEPAALVPQLPRMEAKGGAVEQVGRGLYNTFATGVNALPTAGTVSAIVNPIARIPVLAFTAKQAIQGMPDLKQTLTDPNVPLANKVEASANTALLAAGTVGLAKGTMKGTAEMVAPIVERAAPKPTTPPVLAETMPQMVERVKANIAKAEQENLAMNGVQGPLTEVDAVLGQLENIRNTGTIQPKELRPNFSLGEAAPADAVASRKVNAEAVKTLFDMGGEVLRLRKAARESGDEATLNALSIAEKKMQESAVQAFKISRRVSHEALDFWQRPLEAVTPENATPEQVAEIAARWRKINAMVPEMIEVQRQLPVLNSLVQNAREGKMLRATGDAMDYMRSNFFALTSFASDAVSNLSSTAARLPGRIASDVYDLSTRGTMPNLLGAIELIKRPSKVYNLPDEMKVDFGDTFMGEKRRDVLANRGIMETPVAASVNFASTLPARLKGTVDTFFGNVWAASDLMASAVREAKAKGLKGDARQKFIDDFMADPPDAAVASATKLGKEMKFNRPLTELEEKIAGSTGVKALFDAYPRWSFQFARWMADSLGADPAFWRSVKAGNVKGREVAEYLGKTATGVGGVYLVGQAVYDNVDFNTMEYVREDGKRIRLSNLSPIPEALGLAALFKGDKDRAIQAFKFSSFPGSQALQPRGVLTSLIEAVNSASKSDFPEQIVAREFTDFINRLIPGQAVLAALESLHSPEIQEGVGAYIPGISALLPTRSNPATGEPMKPMQQVMGVKFPAIRGTPIPGAARIFTPTEQALIDHGLAVTRPRRTPLLDMAAKDVPKALIGQYEQLLGQETKRLIEPVVTAPGWTAIPFEQRRQVLTQLRTAASNTAKAKLRMGVDPETGVAPKVEDRRVRLLPQFLRDNQFLQQQ